MLVLIALVVALDGGAPPVVAVTVVPAPAPLREAKSILADYAKAIALRQANADADLIVIEGYDGPQP